jgi:CO dehydrogenase maturation factor
MFKIGVSGKGGTGKTTIAALIINFLLKKHLTPILAIDADPNANLGEVLGVEFENTIGKVLGEFLKEKEKLPIGVIKESFINSKLYEILVEEEGFDLLVMGHGEGPQCYCYPNMIIRDCIDKLSSNYRYIVIDNEAGLEHISRRTDGNLDILLLISDPTIKGIKTCAKLKNLAANIGLKIKRNYLIINRVIEEGSITMLAKEIERENLVLLSVIPEDENIRKNSSENIPLVHLNKESSSLKKIDELGEKLVKILTTGRNNWEKSRNPNFL